MARLATIGYETQIGSGTTAHHGEGDADNVPVVEVGTPTFDTTNQRSGAACRACAQGASNYDQITSAITALDRAYFIRAYFRFSDATPGSDVQILEVRANAQALAVVVLDNTGHLFVRDNASTTLGTDSLALSDNTWYRVELKIIVPTTGAGTIELRRDGNVVASSAVADVNNSVATSQIRIGSLSGGTGGITTYVDDVAINDDRSAPHQNSYPGPGQIVLLKPTSTSALGNWVGPQTTGDDTTNLEQNVDNTPPLGVAHSDTDANAGLYVFNAVSAAANSFDVNCQTYTAAGVSGTDVVQIAQALARVSVNTTTGTNTAAVAGVSNPAITANTANNLEQAAIAGTEPAGWKTFRTIPTYAPSVTLGTAPVVRVTKEVANTNAAMCDLLGLLVEYAPAPIDGQTATDKLRLTAPPSTAGYTTRTITAAEATGHLRDGQQVALSRLLLELDDSTDYVISSPSVIRRSVEIRGGRNIIWKAAHIKIDIGDQFHPGANFVEALKVVDGASPTSGRIIHFEGHWYDGPDLGDGVTFNTPSAHIRIGHWRYGDPDNPPGSPCSDSIGRERSGYPVGNRGGNMYEGVEHVHADAWKSNNTYLTLEADRSTIHTSAVGWRFDHGEAASSSTLRRANVVGSVKTITKEGPLGTETTETAWSANTVRSDFEASQDSWTVAPGGTTLTYPYTTSPAPLLGSQSLRVTVTDPTTVRPGVQRTFGSPTDWSDSGASTALSCLVHLESSSSPHPMMRIDAADDAASGTNDEDYWYIGQSFPVEVGVTRRLVCPFPNGVLSALRKVRIVLLVYDNGAGSGSHAFIVDDIATGVGLVTPTFDGPTIEYTGAHALYYYGDGGAEPGPVYLSDYWAEAHPDNQHKNTGSGTGTTTAYYVRYWDEGTQEYVLDPPPGDADLDDFLYRAPPNTGTDSIGDYATWNSTVAPGLHDIEKPAVDGSARVYDGPPPDGDFVAEGLAGVNYVGAGYFAETFRTAAVAATAGISASGMVVLERSASVSAAAGIASAGRTSVHNRSATISAAARITLGGGPINVDVEMVREPEVLTASLEIRGGQSLRFGPDHDAEEIPLEVSFDTQNPGGFADARLALSRPPWISAADAPLLASFKIEGRAGALRWQGRVKGTPQVDATTISVEGEGMAAALSDNAYFRFLGVSNDLGAWDGPSVARQQALIFTGVFPQVDGGVEPDGTGWPRIATRITPPIAAESTCEMWYRPGIPIGNIRGSWERSSLTQYEFELISNWEVMLGTDDVVDVDTTGNLNEAGPGTFSLDAGGGDRRTAALKFTQLFLSEDDGAPLVIWWLPSVFGRHAIQPHQLEDGRWGLRDEDVIAELALSANGIEVDRTRIIGAGFVIPNVVQSKGTIQGLIEEITIYGGPGGRLNDWGVYESFFWRPPGWGRTWRVRRDQTAEPVLAGPSAENQCTGMVVTYSDSTGERSVGPPGSGADFETPVLEDTSPTNVATRVPGGVIREREAGVTSQTGAINIGAAALREANMEQRSQSIQIIGEAQDEAGAWHDACEMRACDSVVVADEGGAQPPEELPITSTSYDHSSATLTAQAGIVLPSIETLIARLAARTING